MVIKQRHRYIVTFLGSASQAKAILCYLLTLLKQLTTSRNHCRCKYHARRNAEMYPSIADDAEPPQRKGRLFVHKLLNDISGRVEVSSTMAALCVLGGEAEVYTDKFSFVFNTAAIEVSIQS